MFQVKEFRQKDNASLEAQINLWLAQNNGKLEPISVSYSESAATYHSMSTHGDAISRSRGALVLYRFL